MNRRMNVLLGLIFLVPAPGYAQAVTGQELLGYVKRIEGKSNDERRAYIKDQLRRWKVRYQTMPFKAAVRGQDVLRAGENIIVPIGNGKKKIVVGAHCDAAPNSPGANDNGGGVAVVLGLIRSLNDYPWKHKVEFCFFDQEENGLLGSREYVKKYGDSESHLAMINLDVEGTGDEVFVGPVGGGDDDRLMPLARQAAKRTGYPFVEREKYPPSDHLSFANAKLENISISVVPKGDPDKLIAMFSGQNLDRSNLPSIMKVMHTPHDSSKYMSAKALGMSYEFTKTLLLLLHESK